MKKIYIVALSLLFTSNQLLAQQPMTIAPGLNINAPTAGTSGLKFNNLNVNTTVSTTPTKVLSLDASGNVILGNAASGGGSQWTTGLNNNIYYGVGNLSNVGIGTAEPFSPLVVRDAAGQSNTAVFQVEKTGNRTPLQSFVKFGGTSSAAAPITVGEMGVIQFSGSVDNSFGSWGPAASIKAVAKGTFSNTNIPGQLEFATTPTGSTGPNTGPISRMIINEEGRVGINTPTPMALLDVSSTPSTLNINPLINLMNDATNPITIKYTRNTGSNWAVTQETSPGQTNGTTSINWKFINTAGSPISLFGYSAGVFDINGAINASGNSTVGGNSTVTGTSTVGGTGFFGGRLTIGAASSITGVGVEIRSSAGTDANPDIYLKGTTNVIRLGNNVDANSLIQTSTSNNTPALANIVWKHLNNSISPGVSTPMMTLQGDGDLTVNGFTKLGSGADVPDIKTKVLTGTITAGAATETNASLTTVVTHGLTADKIIDVRVFLKNPNGNVVGEGFTDNRPTTPLAGYQFSTSFDGTNIYILRNNGNSSNLANTTGTLRATYRIYITYVQ